MNIYQFKIALKHIAPPVWRRFMVNSDMKFPDFHKVLQTVMGWNDCHLHQFIIDNEYYAPEFEDIEQIGINYKSIKLEDLIVKERQKFFYEYDFGDGWEHIIILEKILPDNKKFQYPVSLSGKRSCPPENCGSIPGYERLLEALKDPHNKKYEEILEWLEPNGFDPEYFNLNEINFLLQEKDYGCSSIMW